MEWDYLSWLEDFRTNGQGLCRGEHIYLRELRLEDTDEIIRWRNSAFVREHFIYQEDFTRASHIRWFASQLLTGRAVQFLVLANEDKRHLGSVYLRDIDHVHRRAELGIFLGEPSACGHGIGTEAVRLLVRYGFDGLRLHRIFLRVFPENERAVAAYRKAGFRVEGRLHDGVCIDGRYRDMFLMSILLGAEG